MVRITRRVGRFLSFRIDKKSVCPDTLIMKTTQSTAVLFPMTIKVDVAEMAKLNAVQITLPAPKKGKVC